MLTNRYFRFWRPPYGDVDNRVRAIAKNVFGLTTVIWNHDTEDWTLSSTPPGTTPEAIQKNLAKWITGPKNPGLVILEHELSKGSVQAFIDAYPSMKSNGWNVLSVPDALNSPWYFNAANDTGPVVASMDPGMTSQIAGAPITSAAAAAPVTATSAAASAALASASASAKSTANSNSALQLPTPLIAALLSLGFSFLLGGF